jgi:predicted DNA-binding transcriptional regulator AlpA
VAAQGVSIKEPSMSLPHEGFVRLAAIIKPHGPIPVSKSSWWAGIRSGRFPKPMHIGRTAVWRVEDIRDLIKRVTEEGGRSLR